MGCEGFCNHCGGRCWGAELDKTIRERDEARSALENSTPNSTRKAMTGMLRERAEKAERERDEARASFADADNLAKQTEWRSSALAARVEELKSTRDEQLERIMNADAEIESLFARCAELEAVLRSIDKWIIPRFSPLTCDANVVIDGKMIRGMIANALARTPIDALERRDLERAVVEAARIAAEWALEQGHAPAGFLGDFKTLRNTLAALDATKKQE